RYTRERHRLWAGRSNGPLERSDQRRDRQGGAVHDRKEPMTNLSVLRPPNLGPELDRTNRVIHYLEKSHRDPDGKYVAARGDVVEELVQQLVGHVRVGGRA